jgi:hypothetical protein
MGAVGDQVGPEMSRAGARAEGNPDGRNVGPQKWRNPTEFH